MRKKWTEIEDKYLIDQYRIGKKEEIISHLKRSWSSIQTRASDLKLKRINIEICGKEMEIWSKEECVYLKQMYGLLDKHTLTSVLNRSWPSIQNKAFLLKIKRETNANSRKLISETNESYYWLGFLMADGHFNKNGQIQINLAEKDLKHLQKLGKNATFSKH